MRLQQILPRCQHGIEVIREKVCCGVLDIPGQVHGCIGCDQQDEQRN
jgi:hypothetical protein